LGVFPGKPDFRDRPVSGVFRPHFPDYLYNPAESGMDDFAGRETGQFKPVWTEERLPGYLEYVEYRKTLFFLEVRDPSVLTDPHLWENGEF